MRISDWSSDVCSSDLLGKSGLAAARALHASGAEVWAWDDSEDQRAKAREAEIPLVDLNSVNWQEVTSLILSPGIPHSFPARSEEHTSELQSLMRISYAVFCLTKKKPTLPTQQHTYS